MVSSFFSSFAALLILPGLFSGFFSTEPALAALTDNLSGFAWSPNVGWLSFNCTDASPPCDGVPDDSNYGVTVGVGAVTRNISGYAWSSNLGWITFNAADMAMSVLPESATCGTLAYPPCSPTAILTVSNGQVSGWARACSVFLSGCSGGLKPDADRGGWDGWISLRNANYGVLANGSKWTGFAWGGGSFPGSASPPVGGNAVTGWVGFRGFTTEATPSIYGINATGNAVGPQVISCGANKQTAIRGSEVVTWAVAVDDTILAGPYTYTWGGNNGPTGSCSSACTKNHSVNRTYSTLAPNPKTAWVTVTANGVPYEVPCDASAIIGQPWAWYSAVTILPVFNLEGNKANSVTGALQGVPIAVTGLYDNQGDAISSPFTIQFQFDKLPYCVDPLNCTPDEVSGLDVEASAVAGDDKIPTSANWTPASQGSYKVRSCADYPLPGSISEGLLDTEANNCSPWVLLTVGPPPAPTGGTCRAVPSVTSPNKTVTWQIDPGSISNGTLPLTYQWTSLTTGAGNTFSAPTNGATKTHTYTVGGVKKARVTVTDSASPVPGVLVIDCTGNARIQVITEV